MDVPSAAIFITLVCYSLLLIQFQPNLHQHLPSAVGLLGFFIVLGGLSTNTPIVHFMLLALACLLIFTMLLMSKQNVWFCLTHKPYYLLIAIHLLSIAYISFIDTSLGFTYNGLLLTFIYLILFTTTSLLFNDKKVTPYMHWLWPLSGVVFLNPEQTQFGIDYSYWLICHGLLIIYLWKKCHDQ